LTNSFFCIIKLGLNFKGGEMADKKVKKATTKKAVSVSKPVAKKTVAKKKTAKK